VTPFAITTDDQRIHYGDFIDKTESHYYTNIVQSSTALISFTLTMKFLSFFVAYVSVTTVSSFTCQPNEGTNKLKSLKATTTSDNEDDVPKCQPTRADFVRQSAMIAAFAAVGASTFGVGVEPAAARGRATLEFAYEKYTPRIEAGGVFYKNKLKTLIANNDFAGLKRALQEPPKKTYVFVLFCF
jgi:hypothetical protein